MLRRIPEPLEAANQMVQGPNGWVHLTDRPGYGPPVLLMHGFPDDSRIYDRLVQLLAPRRVVALDWLGYGRSERATPHPWDITDHQRTLRAVLDSLELEHVVLVGHDASGPDAIDYALSEPSRIAHLILLNTFYGHAPMLRLPEMIRLLADQQLAPLAEAMINDPNQRRWLLGHTGKRFRLDPANQSGVAATSIVPQFFGEVGNADSLTAIRGWTGALFPALDLQDNNIAAKRLEALEVPVTLVFGARDEYLSPYLARHLAALFTNANVRLVEDASHWPQWDQPEIVADVIKEAR
jgi:haloalkane dehalogenase